MMVESCTYSELFSVFQRILHDILVLTQLGGAEAIFYSVVHALKTYWRVRESSSRAMCGLACAETLLDKI